MIYRLFIAADLPQPIKTALVAAQQQLQSRRLPMRWSAPDAMHLTLRFLGDTSSDEVPRIEQAMQQALDGRPPIALHLTALGAFPNLHRPSVVWAGVGGGTTALGQIQSNLETKLEAIGIARDARAFHPHLTLGRVRRDAEAGALEQVRAALRQAPALPPLAWPVERVILFRSELRREGSHYTEIAVVQL